MVVCGVLQFAEKSAIHLYRQSIYRHRPICLIFPLNPSNENVSRVYRVSRAHCGNLSAVSDRANYRIRPVYIGSQTPRAPEGSIRAGKTVGPGLIHFVCFTSIAFKCHTLPQICHVQSVESGGADSSRYQEPSGL